MTTATFIIGRAACHSVVIAFVPDVIVEARLAIWYRQSTRDTERLVRVVQVRMQRLEQSGQLPVHPCMHAWLLPDHYCIPYATAIRAIQSQLIPAFQVV